MTSVGWVLKHKTYYVQNNRKTMLYKLTENVIVMYNFSVWILEYNPVSTVQRRVLWCVTLCDLCLPQQAINLGCFEVST